MDCTFKVLKYSGPNIGDIERHDVMLVRPKLDNEVAKHKQRKPITPTSVVSAMLQRASAEGVVEDILAAPTPSGKGKRKMSVKRDHGFGMFDFLVSDLESHSENGKTAPLLSFTA